MKIFWKLVYALAVVLIGILVYSGATVKMHKNFYNDVGLKHQQEDNREEYMNAFFEANRSESDLTYKSYLKKPIYEANSFDEKLPFSFSIYHATTTKENSSLLLFYFDDRNINDLSKSIDYESMVYDAELLKRNNMLAIVRLNIYIDNDIYPTTNYFSIKLEKRKPIPIIGIENIEDKPSFSYLKKESENDKKPSPSNGSSITKMELVFEDYTKDTKTAIKTNIALFESNDSNNMDNKDILELHNEVMKSNNFNGNIDKYDVMDQYENETLIYTITRDVFKGYYGTVVKGLVIYIIIAGLITYIYFFLPSTINYFKNKPKKERIVK